MSAIIFQVTAAGRAALVNAANTGTLPVTIAHVGVTDQAFTATVDDTALPGELKQLATFSGAAVAADTLHVTIRDDSADSYSMRGFGLYLDDGTLFALYGQADAILEKSTQAMLLLAADCIFAAIDATSLTVGDTDFMLPPATTTVQGVVELADESEAKAGTDGTRAMTPAAHKAATDNRFGEGAPTTFVKSLLLKASAAAVRLALGLKSAATYATGAGNGLDADKLDGNDGTWYIDWGNFVDVPTSFPPSAHTHPWSAITSKPATATRWAAWDEVTDKPTTFPPAAHSHAMSDITGLSTALAAKMSTTWTLTAGAGLTGGGSGSANRTLRLGEPGTVSGSSSNGASGSTHTHALSVSWGDIGAKPTFTDENVPGAVATRNTSGDITVRLVKSEYPASSAISGAIAYRVDNDGNSYIRFCNSPAAVRSWLQLGSAATHSTGYFATGAQGDRADAAMPRTGGTFSGNIAAPNIETTASDARLKRNIRRDRARWRGIRKRVEMVLYDMRDGSEQDAPGVLAQEVQALSRDFVYTLPDGKLAVRYSRLALACAIDPEAEERAAAAEARLAGMQCVLQELTERLATLERRA